MPLSGYLKTSDLGRISSISITGNKERRKKLYPTRYDSENASHSVYMRDCAGHVRNESIGGLVPVELFRSSGTKEWVSVGIAKCCVLCWRIIVPPDDNFPEPLPLPVGKSKVEGSGGRGPDKKPRTRRITPEVKAAQQRLMNIFETNWDDFETSELVAIAKLPRVTVNRILAKMVEDKVLIKDIGINESGVRTVVYRSIISQENEA